MKPSLVNQRGQAITEAVLILVMLMGFTLLTATFLKEQEVLKRLIQTPFQHLAGMLQNGIWAPPTASSISHPNAHYRHITIIGDPSR